MPNKPPKDTAQQEFFLPELCRAEALFGLILLAELLVLVLVLAEPFQQGFDWLRLALTSLFVQWVVVLTAAILCTLRTRLTHLGSVSISFIVCALVVLLTLLCSAATHYLRVEYLGLHTDNLFAFYWRNLLISLIMSAIVLRFFYLQSESRRQQQAQLQARLQALQARIQPHFLFNSLNSIASLVASDANKAEQAILDLSDLFRASLAHDDTGLSTWQQELDLARQYLSIEQYRLTDRLRVNWDIEQLPHNTPVAHLSLQPLLENAILHGIQPSISGGEINVSAQLKQGIVHFQVTNPVAQSAKTSTRGMHIALDNIRARLSALFGSAARLTTNTQQGIFTARISYPCPTCSTKAPKDHENLNR